MSVKDLTYKCCRCRHQFVESKAGKKPVPKLGPGATQAVCPRCGCKSFYDMTPQFAWCWASGLIEIGDVMPPDSAGGGGAICIATGPKYALKGLIEAVARHGYGASEGKLLVPGVPEAEDQKAKGEALEQFLAWCNKCRKRDGVEFSKAVS